MIINIRHTGIVVSDLELSIHFYTNVLGLTITSRMIESNWFIESILGLDNTNVTTVKMSAVDGQKIELLHFHSHSGRPNEVRLFDRGITHFAITVVNIEAEYSRLVKLGVRFISPPQRSPDGNAKVAFCQDPDGVYIEIVEEITD